jgi:hypothetical protein
MKTSALNPRFLSNKRRILKICGAIMDEYGKEDNIVLYSEDLLRKSISSRLLEDSDSVATWTDMNVNYYERAVGMIYTTSYDLLVFGNITDSFTRRSLRYFHRKSAKYGIEHGLLSKEDLDQDYDDMNYISKML